MTQNKPILENLSSETGIPIFEIYEENGKLYTKPWLRPKGKGKVKFIRGNLNEEK